MLDAKKIAAIKKAIVYSPVNGTFRRVGWSANVYLKPNHGGSPRVLVLGEEYAARLLAYLLMTGEYLGKHELKSKDGNPFNLKWENILRTKPGYKFCNKCREEKTLVEFPKNKKRPNEAASTCKECVKPWRANSSRKRALKKFGLTIDEYERNLERQDGVCAICKRVEVDKRLAVDHCHETGKVRGLLCMRCNTAIGNLNTVQLLEAAKEYVNP